MYANAPEFSGCSCSERSACSKHYFCRSSSYWWWSNGKACESHFVGFHDIRFRTSLSSMLDSRRGLAFTYHLYTHPCADAKPTINVTRSYLPSYQLLRGRKVNIGVRIHVIYIWKPKSYAYKEAEEWEVGRLKITRLAAWIEIEIGRDYF